MHLIRPPCVGLKPSLPQRKLLQPHCDARQSIRPRVVGCDSPHPLVRTWRLRQLSRRPLAPKPELVVPTKLVVPEESVGRDLVRHVERQPLPEADTIRPADDLPFVVFPLDVELGHIETNALGLGAERGPVRVPSHTMQSVSGESAGDPDVQVAKRLDARLHRRQLGAAGRIDRSIAPGPARTRWYATSAHPGHGRSRTRAASSPAWPRAHRRRRGLLVRESLQLLRGRRGSDRRARSRGSGARYSRCRSARFSSTRV